MKNATLRAALAALCIGVITVCAVLLFSAWSGRARIADLTDGSLYTLSAGTDRIMEKLNQPVTLTLYYSRVAARKGPEQIRFWNNYYLYVRDLLAEYASRSEGKLILRAVDPRPYSEEEEEAIAQGVKRFQLSEDESFFFGLVASTELGKKKVIPFFEPNRQEFVEYDVSKLLGDLMQRARRKIGVISSLPMTGGDMSPYMMQMMQMQGKAPPKAWVVIADLKQSYEVEKVEVDEKEAAIPAGIDFLFVVHPKKLSESALYAIDQFVMSGGKLLVAVDPHCMVDQPQRQPGNPYAGMNHNSASDLNGLLAKWGVKSVSGKIAVDRTLALTTQLRRDRPPAPFYPFLRLTGKNTNPDQVVTASLNGLQMLFAGGLQKVDGAETELAMLLQTSKVGSYWKPAGPFELRMPDPAAVRRAVTDGVEPVMLACALRGNFATNYPEGIEVAGDPPPAKEEDKEKDGEKKDGEEEKPAPKKRLTPRTTSRPGAAVVVVADVDIFTDRMAYRETFFGQARNLDNAALLFNCFDYLAGDEDLIAVRTRGRYERPFTRVEAIEDEAEKATTEQVDALNSKIQTFQAQLRELGSGANEKNIELIQNEALAKRRNLEGEIRKANKELRRLQAKRREKVEALAASLQHLNMAAAPSIILLIAIALAGMRWQRARRHAVRRT